MFGRDNYRLGKYYINLGAAYYEIGDIAKILYYLDEAERIYTTNFGRQYKYLSVIYLDKALWYRKMGDYERSENYYASALRIANENPNMYFNPKGDIYGSWGYFFSEIGDNHFRVGEINSALDDYAKAIEFTKKAINLKEKKRTNRDSLFVWKFRRLL